MTGKRFDRPEFVKMLALARRGDVIAVWRLDRLGCSLKDLIETVTTRGQRGIELRSIKKNLDTMTPAGKLMFHVIGALAEFERDIIRERTKAGLDADCVRQSPVCRQAKSRAGDHTDDRLSEAVLERGKSAKFLLYPHV
ncbi:MAG: recombinase family protein [Herpetosiphon sp.]